MWDKVVFVCKSDTCRAPMAAALLRECNLKRDIEIEARGLVVLFPEPINQKVSAVMISNGINMEDYMSEQLVAERIHWYLSWRQSIYHRCWQLLGRISCLRCRCLQHW